MSAQTPVSVEQATRIGEVLDFWSNAGPSRWFTKDEAFDSLFDDRFRSLHDRAAEKRLGGWASTASGSLALVVLLDQFPRNVFRQSARSFATDEHALRVAREAIRAGFDHGVDRSIRAFFYMPFMHSERAADQDICVALTRQSGEGTRIAATTHQDIIRRFGRFPHRNRLLGRPTTTPEQAFLDSGGFTG